MEPIVPQWPRAVRVVLPIIAGAAAWSMLIAVARILA